MLVNMLDVLHQVGALGKRYPTVADEGSFARMRPEMIIELVETMVQTPTFVLEFTVEQAVNRFLLHDARCHELIYDILVANRNWLAEVHNRRVKVLGQDNANRPRGLHALVLLHQFSDEGFGEDLGHIFEVVVAFQVLPCLAMEAYLLQCHVFVDEIGAKLRRHHARDLRDGVLLDGFGAHGADERELGLVRLGRCFLEAGGVIATFNLLWDNILRNTLFTRIRAFSCNLLILD